MDDNFLFSKFFHKRRAASAAREEPESLTTDNHDEKACFVSKLSHTVNTSANVADAADNTSNARDIVELATAFILTRTDIELSRLALKDTATAIGVDGSDLSKEFELNLKITFEKFVEREKVHRAAFTLKKERAITIEKLAKRLGFATIREFAKAFEEYFLIEPQNYKRIINKLEENITA